MKLNFLYQITAASRLGDYRPQIPVLSVLCPRLNLLYPHPRTKFLDTPLDSSTLKVAIDCSRKVSAFYLLVQRMMMTYCTRNV